MTMAFRLHDILLLITVKTSQLFVIRLLLTACQGRAEEHDTVHGIDIVLFWDLELVYLSSFLVSVLAFKVTTSTESNSKPSHYSKHIM